jgi:hypothetical protein
MAIIRTTSHRSRDKLKSLLGYDPQGYFSFFKHGDWREVPDDKLDEILKIKGITKSKLPDKAMQYIDWN